MTKMTRLLRIEVTPNGFFASLLGALLFSTCSTQQVTPLATMPEVPVYLGVTHPSGYTLGDLEAVLYSGNIPKGEDLSKCDEPYQKLKERTQSHPEIRQGIKELVIQNPVKYHWCFYYKIRELQDALVQESNLRARQARLLDMYSFLVPIAQSFREEYQDTRYWRWAIVHYTQMSEWLFDRPLQPGKEWEELLAQGWKTPETYFQQTPRQETGILQKYGIQQEPQEPKDGGGASGAKNAELARTPASDPTAPEDPSKAVSAPSVPSVTKAPKGKKVKKAGAKTSAKATKTTSKTLNAKPTTAKVQTPSP